MSFRLTSIRRDGNWRKLELEEMGIGGNGNWRKWELEEIATTKKSITRYR